MGIHSGPVSEVTDVSGRTNLAGAGINMAQRVMDCGDAGHILLSKHVARRSGRIPEMATALARSWFVRIEAWRARLGREPL
jgi:class 3 adenylate cyclase